MKAAGATARPPAEPRPRPPSDAESFPSKHGPILAAMVAAGASLPALRLPFLADDWALLQATGPAGVSGTPFGYFRPLTTATLAADRALWGLSPPLFHLTNLALIAAAAALAVLVIRRATGDPRLACAAGLLFALHPYHVENAGWIAARADPLCALFFFGALLAYDRWRASPRGLPLLALLLFEAALLAKEAAVSLPLLLLVISLCDRSRRLSPEEMARGILPMAGLAAAHFLLLRPAALGGFGLAPLGGFGGGWIRNLCSFLTAALIPLHTEFLETRPRLWGAVALALAMILIFAARAGTGRIPPQARAAAAALLVLLAPSLLSFQERYFFLPSAAAALALASLLLGSPRRARVSLASLLMLVWIPALAVHWMAWSEAGRASSRLIRDLVRASLRPGVREVLVVNMPYRIQGVALAGNYRAALALSGGRPLPVRAAVSLDLPSRVSDGLAGEPLPRHDPQRSGFDVRLRIREEVFSRYVRWPSGPEQRGDRPEGDRVAFDGKGGAIVTVYSAEDGGKAAYVWRKGRLEKLF